VATEVKQFMVDREMSRLDFSRLFGVSIRTVTYWAQGKIPAPFAVVALMRAVQSGRLDMDWLMLEGERERGDA
jgi:DNA-binding transcriptional regulator YiaG